MTTYHTVTGVIKQINVEHRMIEFIASHELVDGHGELIKIDGIDLTRFLQNPVLLLGHTYNANSAVAQVTDLRKTMVDGVPALVGKAYFPDRPQSNEALADVRSGLLNAVSIGADQVETGPPERPGQRGHTITKCSLIEISLVVVPACQTCLITAKEHSMNTSCNSCDRNEIEITLEQLNAIPGIVKSCIDAQLRRSGPGSSAEIDLSPAQLAALPTIVRRAFNEAIQSEVQTVVNRLRGRVD